MPNKHYFVYIATNPGQTVLYTGVTNNLVRRMYEHREKLAPGFTARYNVNRLVYYEVCDDPETAIAREKQIKAGSRQRKLDLINRFNSNFEDLYPTITG